MQDAGKIVKYIESSLSAETRYQLLIGIQTDQLTDAIQWIVITTMFYFDILSSVCMVELAIQKVYNFSCCDVGSWQNRKRHRQLCVGRNKIRHRLLIGIETDQLTDAI